MPPSLAGALTSVLRGPCHGPLVPFGYYGSLACRLFTAGGGEPPTPRLPHDEAVHAWWVAERLLAGEYPGDPDPSRAATGCAYLGHDAAVTKRVESILGRPVYALGEAAALLGLRPDRSRAWLDGYDRAGVRYAPVIRAEPTGDEIVTWGEFVELGYLREYRRKGVPLQRLRPVIDELRKESSTPYPLATARPYVYGKELVLELQERNDIPRPIAIVISSGQTIALAHEAMRFLKKVEFDPPEDGDVRRLHPAGMASPVVIDPLIRFGRPSVRGVATERLWELFDAGEPVEDIASGYEMGTELVRAAVAYEEQQRSLAA
jgi:uncharacterized protein (DUF433 family)